MKAKLPPSFNNDFLTLSVIYASGYYELVQLCLAHLVADIALSAYFLASSSTCR